MSLPTVTNFSRELKSHLNPAQPGQTYGVMPKRPLGATGLRVGVIGVAAGSLLGPAHAPTPDAEVRFTLGQALDMEASLIDVSFAEGQGRALRQLGWAMQGRRAQAVVCLRVGVTADGARDDSALGIRAQVHAALNALGTDHVDIALWDRPAFGQLKAEAPALQALAALKKEGKVRAWGLSLEAADGVRAALEQCGAEVLAFPFNAFHQAAAAVFADAHARGVGLLALRPLDGGWLAGRYGWLGGLLDPKRRWKPAGLPRRLRLQKAFEAIVMRPTQRAQEGALAFVLSHPELACAVAGVSDWHQVVANVDAARVTLEPAQLAAVKDLWREQLQREPLPL
jgi:aryl-alcohol dehydrogenase-like predicted oxidoreductase